jgi:hypothetical protein
VPQRNYLVSTTALSLTQSGTTIASGNTVSATFEVSRTLVRTGLSAGELTSGSFTWTIHYVVSGMTTPYEMRLKLQRRNSSGVMQSESSYGTTRSATGTYSDNITWDSGTWAANDQLALVWEHRRPSGTGNKTGTIDANGASYVDAVLPPTVVIPGVVTLTISLFAPKLVRAIIPTVVALSLSTFTPVVAKAIIPSPAALTTVGFALKLDFKVALGTVALSLNTFAPSVTATQNITVTPSTRPLTISSFAPAIQFGPLIYLDPGGDQVQGLGYFAIDSGLVPATFDTSQKVNGVGSYKFDSGEGNFTSLLKTPGVLGQARRIGFYFRYNSVPNTDGDINGFTGNFTPYSGEGFTNPFFLSADDSQYATAAPAKNGAQGSTLSDFGLEGGVPEAAIIDSIKIVYQRKYLTTDSIGISRVRWVVDGAEGPNHDNTDMPTGDTVVEVDISSDRTWTPTDLASIQVIAEALRGDTDIAHTQAWDYVAVKVDFHGSTAILYGQTTSEFSVLRLELLPTGLGVVLRISDASVVSTHAYDGITIIPPNEDHRVAVSYVRHGVDDLEVKVFLDSIEELSLVEVNTGGQSVWPDLIYGWIGAGIGANKVCWFDQIYIDDVDDLTDPGPIYMTAKLPAAVNVDDFDTTGGTGAVNERPVNLSNYRQQAGVSQVYQNYTLQAAEVGDVDISDETFIGYMGWAIAKKGSGTGSGVGLTVNGVTTGIDLTTSPALVKAAVLSEDYPSDAAGIGLRSIDGDADTFLYECGAIIAYQGPLEDILFAEYLLLVNQTAEVVDDLRADPPDTYMLRYWIREGGGTAKITAYSITAEGEPPRKWSINGDGTNGGGGMARIGVPGIEVRVVMEVTEADTYVMLQHYLNV